MRWPFSRSETLPNARPLYAALVAEARRPDWYRDAAVPDTMDGRFSVLATLLALADRRLGAGGDAARAIAPRLTELFIADMDAQFREAGFGDPGLGKQVRKLVGALASRTEAWSRVDAADQATVVGSLYRGEPPGDAAVERGQALVEDAIRRLRDTGDEALAAGHLA